MFNFLESILNPIGGKKEAIKATIRRAQQAPGSKHSSECCTQYTLEKYSIKIQSHETSPSLQKKKKTACVKDIQNAETDTIFNRPRISWLSEGPRQDQMPGDEA